MVIVRKVLQLLSVLNVASMFPRTWVEFVDRLRIGLFPSVFVSVY